MEPGTLTLVQSAVQWISAILYLWVARIVLERPLEGSARVANALFGVWWIALGIVFLILPILTVPPRLLGYENLPLAVTILNAVFMLIVAAVWGLVYYLAYLYTGSRRIFWPITAFYVGLAFVLLFLIAWLHPVGFDATGRVSYEREALPGGTGVVLGLFFSGPVVLAALAYGSLFFRVKEAAARYRVGMVSGAFLLQFGWSLVSSMLQLNRRYPNSATLSFISSAIAVLAAIAILMAFKPPRIVRERLAAVAAGGS